MPHSHNVYDTLFCDPCSTIAQTLQVVVPNSGLLAPQTSTHDLHAHTLQKWVAYDQNWTDTSTGKELYMSSRLREQRARLHHLHFGDPQPCRKTARVGRDELPRLLLRLRAGCSMKTALNFSALTRSFNVTVPLTFFSNATLPTAPSSDIDVVLKGRFMTEAM